MENFGNTATNVVSLDTLAQNVEAALKQSQEGDRYVTISAALADIFNLHQRVRRESGVEQLLVDSLYAYSAMYSSTKAAELKASGMSTVYLGLIGEKCTDALAWLYDVFLGETDKPWRLKATPVPTVPEEMTQLALSTGIKEAKAYVEALGREPAEEYAAKAASLVRQAMQDAVLVETDRRAKQMERLIEDQLTEGGWSSALKDFLFDVVVEKAGILKGPIVRERQKREWVTGGKGRPKPQYVWKPTLTVSRVSPFDAYPSASSVGFEGDFIERTRYTIADLFWMLKQKHFIESQVRAVIGEFPGLAGSEVREVDSTIAPILQGQTGQAKVAGTVEGLDFWLTVTGTFLHNAGWHKLPFGGEVKADQLYHIEAITVAGKVVFLGEQEDPRGIKPYYKTGWVSIPGSFWYLGLPENLKDLGDVANASGRSLVNNMGLASGFQVVIPDNQRLLSGSLTNIFPHKVWQFRNPSNSAISPIDFKQPDSNAQELLGIISEMRQLADSRSGVPKYLLGGEPPPGVGRTASGISMLLNSAAKGIRRVVISIDRDVVCPLLEQIYEKNLMESDDASVLGDLEVAPAGAVETLVKAELAERRLGLLDAISKSPDAQLIGVRGRSELWREAFRAAEMDGAALMVPVEKVEQQAEKDAVAAQSKVEAEAAAAQAEAEARGIEVQIAQAKLEVEKQRLTMESKILELKLQAQIAESQQRAQITKRMAAATDLKTAQEIGAINVPTREEGENNDLRNVEGGMEAGGAGEIVPGVPSAGGLPEEIPGEPEQLPPDLGGGSAGSLPGGGAAAENVV